MISRQCHDSRQRIGRMAGRTKQNPPGGLSHWRPRLLVSGAAPWLLIMKLTLEGTQMADIPDTEIARQINVRLEALKQIRDYSASLVVIQSGFVAVIGVLLKTSSTSGSIYLGILFAVLIVSIYFGAVVVAGTVPYIVQRIADNPGCDIYKETGGIPKGKLAKQPLGKLCLLQAHLFIGVLVLFAVFILFYRNSAFP